MGRRTQVSIRDYTDLNSLQLDALKEIGSIGAGNAATSLSSLLNRRIEIGLPEIKIMEYNEAIESLGGPEMIVAGVMRKLSGEINGIGLYILSIDFINIVLESIFNKKIESFEELGEMEISALTEIGNIIIASYVNPMSAMTNTKVNISMPATTINMLGGILSVPMIEYGYQTNHIMTISGNFKCDDREVYSNLILVPDVKSLNYILKELGINND